jgi:hypothetical protein
VPSTCLHTYIHPSESVSKHAALPFGCWELPSVAVSAVGTFVRGSNRHPQMRALIASMMDCSTNSTYVQVLQVKQQIHELRGEGFEPTALKLVHAGKVRRRMPESPHATCAPSLHGCTRCKHASLLLAGSARRADSRRGGHQGRWFRCMHGFQGQGTSNYLPCLRYIIPKLSVRVFNLAGRWCSSPRSSSSVGSSPCSSRCVIPSTCRSCTCHITGGGRASVRRTGV